MEQVAETLRAFKANCSQEEWDEYINLIEEETRDDERIYCFKSEITSVIDSIISVNGKKTPVIEWHDRTDDSEFEPNEQYDWGHDITGEVFTNSSVVDGVYPDCANKWADGTYSGYCFDSNGTEFKTIDGVRGIGYKALIAFDRKGRGIVFF